MALYERHGQVWELPDELPNEQAKSKIDAAYKQTVKKEQSYWKTAKTAFKKGAVETPYKAAAMAARATPPDLLASTIEENIFQPLGIDRHIPKASRFFERMAREQGPTQEEEMRAQTAHPVAYPLMTGVAEAPLYATLGGAATAGGATTAAAGMFSGATMGAARSEGQPLPEQIKSMTIEAVLGGVFGKLADKLMGTPAEREMAQLYRRYKNFKVEDVPEEALERMIRPAKGDRLRAAVMPDEGFPPDLPNAVEDYVISKHAAIREGTPRPRVDPVSGRTNVPEMTTPGAIGGREVTKKVITNPEREKFPFLFARDTPDKYPAYPKTRTTTGKSIEEVLPIPEKIMKDTIKADKEIFFPAKGKVLTLASKESPIVKGTVEKIGKTKAERLKNTIYRQFPELADEAMTPEQRAGILTPDDAMAIKDYGSTSSPPRSVAQTQGQTDILSGGYTVPIEEKIFNVAQERTALYTEDAARLGSEFVDIGKKFGLVNKVGVWNKKGRAVVDIMRNTKNEETRKLSVAQLKKIYPQYREKDLTAAKEVRAWFDGIRDMVNPAREQWGKDPIGEFESYLPLVERQSLWNKLVSDNTQYSRSFDFSVPNAKANPHAFKRFQISSPDQINDLDKLAEIYLHNSLNDIHMMPAIEHIKMNTNVLREAGKNSAANYWDDYARISLGREFGNLDKAAGIIGSSKRRAILEKYAVMRVRSALAGAVSWVTGIQPTSAFLFSGKMSGYKNAAVGALKYLKGDPEVMNAVNASTSFRIKTKGLATYANRGMEDRVRRIARTYGDVVADGFNWLSNSLEKHLQGSAIAGGLERGKQLGYKGQDLLNFANMTGEKVHSMYNRESRALVLNNLSVRALSPFQSFSIEAFQHLKDVAKGTMTRDMTERGKQAAYIVSGMWLANQYTKAVRGDKPTGIGTFIPFVGEQVESSIKRAVSGKDRISEARVPVAPLEDAKMVGEAIREYSTNGSLRGMRRLLVFWGLSPVGGGAQANRIIDGLLASYDGYYRSASGKVLFPVKGAGETTRALIYGPWGTKAGQKYKERMGYDKGIMDYLMEDSKKRKSGRRTY